MGMETVGLDKNSKKLTHIQRGHPFCACNSNVGIGMLL
ncbi:hypothetical protein glysoja_023797 [Glycine soja]|nr:hypothetical protein glysoja_023797 [Glycine soja]